VVRKDDYAKWMLEDPRVNFAISQRRQTRRATPGIQVEDRELGSVCAPAAAEGPVIEEGRDGCTHSEKS
jgi:hypothetical protein